MRAEAPPVPSAWQPVPADFATRTPLGVAVVVPCRNEAGYIDAFVDSALAQVLPPDVSHYTVVVADGASDDGTRARLDARAAADARLAVVDNPERITSAALNRAVLAALRADVVVRMDVHTTYAPDYVAQCVAALRRTGAACVGGAWRPVVEPGRGWVQAAIARAFESRFGSGGAASRRADLEGEVDTVYLGAWWREPLLAIGGFDEALVRNQDDELALRITRAGGRVWQSAAIRSAYAPRASFRALFRQFWQYGYWKVPVIRKHRLPAAPRHLVPVMFVGTLAALLALSFFWAPAGRLFAALAGLYAAAALGFAAPIAAPWARPREWLGVAWAFGCMHVGYGLGFARALIDVSLLRRGPATSATTLTR